MGKADTFFQTIHIADNNLCSHRSFLRCVESLIYNLYCISILLDTQFPYLIICNMITLICLIH